MASGTQSYQSTSGSLIDPAQRELDKLGNKDKKKEKVEGFKRKLITIFDTYTNDIEATAGMLTGVSNNLLEPSGNALPSAEDLDPNNPQDGVIKALTGISDDIKAQNQILVLQTKMLTATLDMQNKLNSDTKRLRREERAEETEDLSGTQGVVNTVAKTVGGGGGSNLLGNISNLTNILADVNRLRNIPRWFKKFKFSMPNFGRAANAADTAQDISRVASTTNLLPDAPGSTRTILNNADVTPKVKTANQFVEAADQIIETPVLSSKVLDDLDEVEEVITNTNKTNKVVSNLDEITEVSEAVTSTNRIVDTADVIGDTSKTTSALAKVDDVIPSTNILGKGMDMLGAIPGAKYILPGASGVSGITNIAQGNFAEGAMDLADASLDVGLMTGAVSQTGTLATTMGPAIAVTGAGLLSGWLGEMTRGTDEWVRGDGTDAARNALGDVTAGLSGALETVGAPFTAMFSGVDSLIKHGDFSESNKKMAEVDSNIREGFRKFLNVWDPLNMISDEVGSFGTLSLYGEENVEAANKKLLVEKGITTEETNENATKNIESTANMIEETTDIEKSIIQTVLEGGTSGNETLDQKIFNEYRMIDLKQRIAELPEGESKELDALYTELKGLESGEINAERPDITTSNVSNDNTTSISNDNTTTGDTTTSSSVVTGDTNNINKPETTVSTVMNNAVKEDPGEKVVVIQQPVQTATNQSNEQKTNDASFQIGLTDTNADSFKDLTLLSALG
tara:strand:+ start:6163 stop:8379 length:2217 start_codon:yes stop_codon:yes gene_type:complete